MGLMVLALSVFALSDVGIFVDQHPEYVAKTVYRTASFSPVVGLSSYREETVVERKANLTKLYPLDMGVKKTQGKLDGDDMYLTGNYNTSALLTCSANATSINDIYGCAKAFNKQLQSEGYGNCRLSTSAFKIAFLNSPLAGQRNGYKLMKAFAQTDGGMSAHRFIILSNKEGNFVIDPFWGAGEDLNASVGRYTAAFFDDAGSANYRGSVYKIDVFHDY
jgi:hypothetical protein